MKTVLGALALCLATVGSPSARAQVEGEPDCQYVTGTLSDLEAKNERDAWVTGNAEYKKTHTEPPVIGKPASATAHLIWVEGCAPQCVGRIFCYSDNPRVVKIVAGENATQEQMTRNGVDVACAPNPDSTMDDPSCPPANECMAMARKNKALQGVATAAASGPLTFKNKASQEIPVSFGLNRKSPATRLPKFTIPADPTRPNPGKACSVCVSTISVAEFGNAFAACGALDTGECKSASACAEEANTSPTGNSRPVTRAQQVHYEPRPGKGGGSTAKGATP